MTAAMPPVPPTPGSYTAAKPARTFQIASGVLAVLLVAALGFGFTKSSAASSAKAESADKSERITELNGSISAAQDAQAAASEQAVVCAASATAGEAIIAYLLGNAKYPGDGVVEAWGADTEACIGSGA